VERKGRGRGIKGERKAESKGRVKRKESEKEDEGNWERKRKGEEGMDGKRKAMLKNRE
jgi:hypothetical protein